MARTDEGNLVEAARSGDSQAFGQLFDTWFDRVHDLSRRIVKDTGTAGEVAQDAFLTAWTRLDSLDDPDAFGGWLLRIARNASLNRLSKERRSVALDSETMTTLSDLDAPDHDPIAAMDQAARIDLVWDAAAALGERDMSILDLHLRHGLGAPELAEELGTTANNAHQILFTLRKRLGTNVRALVLWRAGRPACGDLRRALAAAGIGTFDKQAVKVIDRHAAVCSSCNDERSERLAPASLFGAAPVVAAPILLKAQAASALEAAGVPMSGSASLGGTGGTVGSADPATPMQGAATPTISAVDPIDPPPDAPAAASGGGDDGGRDGGSGGGDDDGGNGGNGGKDGDDHHQDHGGSPFAHGATLRRRRVRILAATVALLAIIGTAVLISGAFDDHGPTLVAATNSSTTTWNDTTTSRVGADGPPWSFPLTRQTVPTLSTGTLVITEDTAAPDTTEAPSSRGPRDTAPPGNGRPGYDPQPDDQDLPRDTAPPGGGRPGFETTTTTTTTTTTPRDTTTTAPPDTTTTAPTIPAPAILHLSALTDGVQCPNVPGALLYEVAWQTTDATTAVVTFGNLAPMSVPPSGTVTLCATRANANPEVGLAASGPGGDTFRTTIGQRR